MTDTVRVPRTTVVRLLAVVPKGSGLAVHLAAMLAASPQGEGDCVCVQRGDGPEGCGLCNETGVVTEGVKPQPDALPGDLREKVAKGLCRIVRTWQGFKGTPEYTLDMEVENAWDDWLTEADAILSLIQSERGGG